MCEQDPSTWESLATQRWQEYSHDQGARVPAAPGEVLDSTTGETLDPIKVQEGCDEEMKFMSQMHVWDRVTRVSAQSDPEGNIVGTRWVFVNKGDKVRCRLVAQEFVGSDKREDLYAGTPPLSATRYLLSNTASRRWKLGIPFNFAVYGDYCMDGRVDDPLGHLFNRGTHRCW